MKNIPNRIKEYFNNLKLNNRNEVYELLLLMTLRENFLEALDKTIQKSRASVEFDGITLKYCIYSSQEYEAIIEDICKSEYFIKNYSASERLRKKKIAKDILLEISGAIVLEDVAKSGKFGIALKDIKFQLSLQSLKFPQIQSQEIKECGFTYTDIRITDQTTLNELNMYAKEILKLSNKPKKKKLSLGRGIRMIDVEEKISTEEQVNIGYKEQVIAKHMKLKYGEKMTFDATKKLLQRTKKIKKQINTPWDK